jgi:hypothetical protein
MQNKKYMCKNNIKLIYLTLYTVRVNLKSINILSLVKTVNKLSLMKTIIKISRINNIPLHSL